MADQTSTDWWGSNGLAPQADPVTDFFTQTVGRAPTPGELSAYQASQAAGQDWQTQIKDNAAAPNGWANYLQYGNVTGAAPAAPAAPSPAQTFAPTQALSLPQMAAPTATQTTFTPMGAPTPYTLPTAAEVAQTPGYQFTRDQGIRGVENSDIARGAGLGGAALKDIAGYTTGLADTYYGNRVSQGLAANNQNFGQNLATNQFNLGGALSTNAQNFGQNLATNQFNTGTGLNQFGANLGANQQFWGQGLAENQNAYNQYRGLQNDAFNQWLSLAQLGNPGNPYA